MRPIPKIMIVEDEIIVALEVQRLLQDQGYEVPWIYDSGEEALKKIPLFQPDLILMDIKLSGKMNGIDTAQAIRTYGNIPLIYLSGYLTGQIALRLQLTRPRGLINKPFRVEDFIQTINASLYEGIGEISET